MIKKITGNCPIGSGLTTVAHGLTKSKIIGMSGIVNAASGALVPNGYDLDAYRWSFYIDDDYILVDTGSVAAQISERPFTILLTYEE